MRAQLRSRAQFRPVRVLALPPAIAVAAGAARLLPGTGRYADPLLVVALLSAALLGLVAATGRLTIDGSTLYTRSIRNTGTRSLAQTVDLDRLVSVSSVGWRYGRAMRTGPAWAREFLLFEDGTGNRALAWAWGWTPRARLRAILRDAVIDSGCAVDRLTARRLGLRRPA